MTRRFKLLFKLVFGVFCLVCLPTVVPAQAPSHTTSPLSSIHAVFHHPLFISVATVRRQVKTNRPLLLVDVRRADAYDQLHIPDSLHVPLHFIRTKVYLKKTPMVLVHADMAIRALSASCRQLREAGFDVRIMTGGLNAWQAQGGPLIGNPQVKHELDLLTAAVVMQDHKSPLWQVIDASPALTQLTGELFPHALRLPTGSSVSQAELVKLAAVQSQNPLINLLVVAHQGDSREKIRRSYQAAGLQNIFFLKDGLKAYKNYLNRLEASWASKKTRMVVQSHCTQCGDHHQTTVE